MEREQQATVVKEAKTEHVDLIFTSTDSHRDYGPKVLDMIEELFEKRIILKPGQSSLDRGPLVDSLQQIYAQRASLKMRALHIPKGHIFKGRWLLGVAAALIHMTGEPLSESGACARCREGRGLYALCVQHKDVDQGSCSNCVQVGHLHQCSLRKKQVSRPEPAQSARQSDRNVPKTDIAQESGLPKRAPLSVVHSNIAPATSTANKNLELTPAEQSRVTIALSLRNDESNNVHMPFEDCETLSSLLNEIVEGPYHGLVQSKEAIRALWISASDDAEASKLYLRPSKQSSADSYRQFLGRDVKQRLVQEGSTCVISVVVEV
ncbi:hypothetical protein HII31_10861 [Pseudocercospora fuligena]|uniref:Uncharacterized protein n=1 Tax=Pseudocercospora fuligena TaxID=685502 RepID=A0A8H6RBA4_9PEZI|nr:hypothetical protein HII31_10861 [Pseudocercospora fuligena]